MAASVQNVDSDCTLVAGVEAVVADKSHCVACSGWEHEKMMSDSVLD